MNRVYAAERLRESERAERIMDAAEILIGERVPVADVLRRIVIDSLADSQKVRLQSLVHRARYVSPLGSTADSLSRVAGRLPVC